MRRMLFFESRPFGRNSELEWRCAFEEDVGFVEEWFERTNSVALAKCSILRKLAGGFVCAPRDRNSKTTFKTG